VRVSVRNGSLYFERDGAEPALAAAV
jgi:hypothetical protein